MNFVQSAVLYFKNLKCPALDHGPKLTLLFADLILHKSRQQVINVLRISALNYFVSNCYELLDSAHV